MLNGIDISHWNKKTINTGKIDLMSYAKNNFVIMKSSQGISYRDSCLDYFVSSIFADGNLDKHIGFYHFADAISEDSYIYEASNFIAAVTPYKAYRPVLALDVEASALQKKYIDMWSYNFLSTCEKVLGYKPMIYLQQSACKKFKQVAKGDFGLWVAKWGAKPTAKQIEPWKVYAIWQTGSKNNIDTDIFNGTDKAWFKYAGC